MNHYRHIRLLTRTVVALCILTIPHLVLAAWPPEGRPVCTASSSQTHSVIATDGADGAIIAWMDARFPRVNIFARHVLASGDVDGAWPVDGRALLNDPAAMNNADGGQFNPEIVSDGAGGAIVIWQDLRSAVTETDLFAQHILSTGVVDPTWPANGTALSTALHVQNTHVMVSDGAGGAIVTWVDNRVAANEFDIYAQHVLASGVVDPRWPANGLAVCTPPGAQGFPAIVEDGLGGALITWHDARVGSLGFDVYAQHVLNAGVTDPAWPVNGRAICIFHGDQGRVTIASDGANGAIIAWGDSRVNDTSHIFAQHVFGSGAIDPAWPLNGRGISNAAFLETRARAISDGAGGAIVTWQGFDTELNIFAQHVKSTGVVDPLWPAAGKALSNADRQQSIQELVADGAGGAIIAWVDSVDVVAQHVLASGVFDAAYPATGRSIVNAANKQGDIAIVATSAAGAIVSWTDGRNGLSPDIYALQVKEAGKGPTGVGTPALSGINVNAFPNPFSGSTRISFNSAGNGPVDVRIYDVSGRPVRSFSTRAESNSDIQWDGRTGGGNTAPSGVYFCRVSTPAGQGVRRIVLVR